MWPGIDEIPAGWLPLASQVFVHVDRWRAETVPFGERLPVPANAGGVPASQALIDAIDAVRAAKTVEQQARATFKRALDSVGSTEALKRAWPELYARLLEMGLIVEAPSEPRRRNDFRALDAITRANALLAAKK